MGLEPSGEAGATTGRPRLLPRLHAQACTRCGRASRSRSKAAKSLVTWETTAPGGAETRQTLKSKSETSAEPKELLKSEATSASCPACPEAQGVDLANQASQPSQAAPQASSPLKTAAMQQLTPSSPNNAATSSPPRPRPTPAARRTPSTRTSPIQIRCRAATLATP